MADTPVRPPGWPPNVKTQAEVAELSDISPDCQFLARRRLLWMAEREKGQLEAAIEVERKAHYERQKAAAYALREHGYVIEAKCTILCPVCHPELPEPTKKKPLLEVRDLRHQSKHATPGRRGTCRECGKKCSNPRWILCSAECKTAARKKRNLRACKWCQGTLPEGSRRDREYCGSVCKQRARRQRRKNATSFASNLEEPGQHG